MDFSLNEDQVAIGEMATRLFSDHCDDAHLVAFDKSGAPYDDALWTKVVETGLHGLLVPEAAGGSGLGMTELMAVLQAQGRSLAPVPLWRHQLATATLATFGRGEANDALVAAAVAGECLATLSLDGPLQSRGPSLRANRDGQGWVLEGHCPAVALAAQSRWMLVSAVSDGRARLFAVALPAAGIALVEGIYTHGEPVADIHFRAVRLAEDARLPEQAGPWLEQRGRAAVASLQLGVSEDQLRRTAEYLGERRQFDRAIATFQAVQMQMADGYIQREVLRTSLLQLCYRLDAGQDAEAQAHATKFLASEAGHRIGHMAQHLHGGIGVDVSYPMHRYQLWSRALGMTLGGASNALAHLGDWLAEHDQLGWRYDLEGQTGA
jgi:alkylation response protein AidB-like acyl-CoA dehydrogenase